MKVSPTHEDWRSIVYSGVENSQIDFKSAQDWNELTRAGRAKFARHAMALANTQGGYIVVGVGENASGRPEVYTGMTEKQASSFDPSTVGQTVNRYADPSVEFDIVRPEVDGKTYVVFVVYPFRGMPHVCGDACENELQRGVFYIRTPEARSRAAYRASELHLLIQRSLRNQREMLGRMLRGVLYEDRMVSEVRSERSFDGYIQRARRSADGLFGADDALRLRQPMAELWMMPQSSLRSVGLSELRRVIDELERPLPKDCLWPGTRRSAVYYATNDSLRGEQRESDGTLLSSWEFFQCGLFYCSTPLPVSPAGILSEDLSELLSVGLAFGAQIFAGLNCQTELLTMTLRVRNTLQLSMVPLGESAEVGGARCQIPDIEVSKQRSVGDLIAGEDTAVSSKMFLEVCERFNLQTGPEAFGRIQAHLADYWTRGLLLGR